MISIPSVALAVVALIGLSNAAAEPYPAKALLYRDEGLKALTLKGCYSSPGDGAKNLTWMYNTQGYCQQQCVSLTGGIRYPVIATTNGTGCLCSSEEPSASDKVDDDKCDSICAGYASDMCGGNGYYSVYLTGETEEAVVTSSSSAAPAPTKTPTSSHTTSASPSVVTVGGQTIVVTAPAQIASASAAAEAADKKSSSPNKAAIAAGVVIGVVLIAAAVGGGFLFMRHRKRRQIEEEYQRNAAVSSFIGGGKAPPSSGSNSFNDPRIDPAVLAQRRMSDGSIADNQDYSRRILKVTNA